MSDGFDFPADEGDDRDRCYPARLTPWLDPDQAEAPSLVALSPRDVEVLQLLANGASTAEIAQKLAYSESMIKHVVHGVVTGIGARNRAHAVAIAIRAGVI